MQSTHIINQSIYVLSNNFKTRSIGQQTRSPMSSCDKPIILTFVGHYLPGYKAGGILRTTVNRVDYLCDEFEFWIVTRDRDLGEDKPYPDVKLNQWQQVDNAMVYYLQPKQITVKDILNLILSTPHYVLYLNSFFDSFTIKVLFIRMLGWVNLSHRGVSSHGLH
jgi:hypothetical protein